MNQLSSQATVVGLLLLSRLAVAAPPRLPDEVERAVVAPAVAARDLATARARIAALEVEILRTRLALQQAELLRFAPRRNQLAAAAPGLVPEAYVVRSAIWASATIPVSWENPRPENKDEREWVRAAITRTWDKESELEFTGWGEADSRSQGIRILIADEHPHCKRLGNRLDGLQDGMVLNFSFATWCPACLDDRRGAIEKIAIHEFGHALGFAHEQNRPDAPEWCRSERQGSDGDWEITIYDPDSIMNYCNPAWNNGGQLSPLDVQAVRLLYGPPPGEEGGDPTEPERRPSASESAGASNPGNSPRDKSGSRR